MLDSVTAVVRRGIPSAASLPAACGIGTTVRATASEATASRVLRPPGVAAAFHTTKRDFALARFGIATPTSLSIPAMADARGRVKPTRPEPHKSGAAGFSPSLVLAKCTTCANSVRCCRAPVRAVTSPIAWRRSVGRSRSRSDHDGVHDGRPLSAADGGGRVTADRREAGQAIAVLASLCEALGVGPSEGGGTCSRRER